MFESTPICYRAEKAALKRMVRKFSREMIKKLVEKLDKGFVGWDKTSYIPVLEEKLQEHIERGTDGQEVDIANLAAFLWNMRTR